MISDIQFRFDPRLSQPLDYLDSYAPSIKVSLLWRLNIVVRGHRMANIIRWHSEKAPPRVTGTSRHDSYGQPDRGLNIPVLADDVIGMGEALPGRVLDTPCLPGPRPFDLGPKFPVDSQVIRFPINPPNLDHAIASVIFH
jgi:hypothetical protein